MKLLINLQCIWLCLFHISWRYWFSHLTAMNFDITYTVNREGGNFIENIWKLQVCK